MKPLMLIVWCLLLSGTLAAQELEGEARKQFVAEQDAYLQNLQLSIDQRKSYQQITIQYEKRFQAVEWSGVSEANMKAQRKKLQKAKDAEMKQVLSDRQYKMYVQRQKEIEKKYYE